MNIKNLFLAFLLIAFSACNKPDYEKAIADWIQTDAHGTWTDLKFELLDVLETKDVTVADSLHFLNNQGTRLTAVIEKAENPRTLIKPSFSEYMKAQEELKHINSMKDFYQERDSTEIIAKVMKCQYSIIPPSVGAQQKKTESFLLSSDMKECFGRLRTVNK